ncbi:MULTISPECIES: hypothetical protein [unclassified Streptomyces]|uniref:hypothetical protein n=1 Tax=unclassified Streptomyces TaxID=2593676 RepID=UPI0031F92249
MAAARREPLGPGRLVLDVTDRPGPPPLRFETAADGRLLLRQGERPLLLGRSVTGSAPCCPDLHLHRADGYRSPLPPPTAARLRAPGNWPHTYARRLQEAPGTPLTDGRWELALRTRFQPGIWTEDLVREWPGGSLGLYCGGGWHGVVPLRRLSAPDAARVKAYRKHAREGTLAPVLLWWVPFLDGWLILDGHDRAVAALAEGGPPKCVVLTRLPEEARWREEAEQLAEGHRQRAARLTAVPAHRRTAMDQGYGDLLAGLPYEPAGLPTWPLPGGARAWDALAARAVFQFPGD